MTATANIREVIEKMLENKYRNCKLVGSGRTVTRDAFLPEFNPNRRMFLLLYWFSFSWYY